MRVIRRLIPVYSLMWKDMFWKIDWAILVQYRQPRTFYLVNLMSSSINWRTRLNKPAPCLCIQSVSISAAWNRIKAPFCLSCSITQVSSVTGIVGLCLSPAHTHTVTLTHASAAGLFRVQSLTPLAKGMSNHNCKLIPCPPLWLQPHSHPHFNTSSFCVIAVIVIHWTWYKQLCNNIWFKECCLVHVLFFSLHFFITCADDNSF